MKETIDDLKAQERTHNAKPTDGQERNRAWIPGLILIILGVVFLTDNYFSFPFLDNWWALFILIPAMSNLSRAWGRFREAGRWTADARGSLISGLIIGMVAVIFLFDLSWTLFWPVILIIMGVGLLLRAG